jgi:hypothetical protein
MSNCVGAQQGAISFVEAASGGDMKETIPGLLAWLAAAAASMAVAAPPSGGNTAPDPGAAAVVVDANGKVVGPLVWVPNDGYVFYGEVAAAYRVGSSVARVGFLASKEWTFGVLTRVYRATNLSFTTSDCSGQAYSPYGLPKDYLPYAPVFVVPPISVGGNVIPARIMRQTAATELIADKSGTSDDGTCVANSYPQTRKHFVVDVIGDFPFVAPFSIR